ncbi:hypothetical protein M5362_25265 [Streptomyces sp. Je 1-79]|uniref:hypothetical protein n=1 Tax=Streptomyces sp. Je 1-79 TaxID=2943847 RepID=UPI0021A6ABA8|nr:hypothetical protein [Streptomyces sp. Je 1-79]MCT4356443.1 hypothetical protein [Streptomyces sp. Je 1-79]
MDTGTLAPPAAPTVGGATAPPVPLTAAPTVRTTERPAPPRVSGPPARPAVPPTPPGPAVAPPVLLAGEENDEADPHIVRGID